MGADEDEETSVDVESGELEESPTDPGSRPELPQKPSRAHTDVLTSLAPSNESPERQSRIPGLRFRVQGDSVGQSISPRPRKPSVETLPPGIAPSAYDHVSLPPEGTITKPRPTSVPPPPPPPGASGADLNYQRILQLRRELRALRALQNKHEREIVALRARAEIFEEQLLKLGSETKNGASSSADDQLLRKVALLEDRTVIQQSAISEANATSAARFADLGKRLESLEVTWARRAVSSPALTAVDDLKRIRGIGPKFELLLHDAGVTTFEQIASWTEKDVAQVAEQLGTSSVRIVRDGWVASAKKFSDNKP